MTILNTMSDMAFGLILISIGLILSIMEVVSDWYKYTQYKKVVNVVIIIIILAFTMMGWYIGITAKD